MAYFVWHSLHARVEANWFAPVYPAFAIAAAVAAHLTPWQARRSALADFCRRWALPTGVMMFVAADRAGQYRRAHRLSPRRHGAQRRRRLARARAPRSRRCASRVGADLRAGAGLRHHRLARLLSAEGHLRRAADPAHPLGQHARARCCALEGQAAVSSTRLVPMDAPI